MTRPALQLNKYFFVHIFVQANIDFKPDCKDNIQCLFSVNTHLGINKTDSNKYQLQLDIATTEDTCKNPSYNIVISVVGFFEVDPDFPDKEKLVNVNGATILYAAARELLLSMTSRGPWPAVMLPSHSFLSTRSKYTDKETDDKDSVIKPKPRKKVAKKQSMA